MFVDDFLIPSLVMEYSSELKKLAISQHKERGTIGAEEEWIKCWDVNGISEELAEKREHLNSITKRIKTTMLNLDLISSDDEFEAFRDICLDAEYVSKKEHEIEIEIENRPRNAIFYPNRGSFDYEPITFNKKAVINLSQCTIPEDITMAFSYGPKFLFPFNTTEENIYEITAQLDNCIEDTISPLFQQMASREIANILSKRDKYRYDINVQWLNFINYRTIQFLTENEELTALKSDKGGHVVIVNKSKYDLTIDEMLNSTEYKCLNKSPLIDLIEMEKKLVYICRKNYKCKKIASEIRGYQPNTLQLSKFYGLPKVHKPGFRLRPIVAMIGAPGHALGKAFNVMLKMIFPITEHHLKDSFDAKKFFDGASFPLNYKIISWDVVSMFSNIPTGLAKEIVMNKQEIFLEKFGIGRRILVSILNFLLDESTVFTANGKIYKQNKGLPMGGCISPTIARLVMDRVIQHLLNTVTEIAFVKVFVDDTIAALNPANADKALECLNSFHPDMKFTVENENEQQALNFLNLTVYRFGKGLKTNWYRKQFASGRLVPFFSSHKRTTVIGTAEAFLRTVILLSDPVFFKMNRVEVINTLRVNSFPEWLIESLVNKHYSLLKPVVNTAEKRNINKGKIYKIFPHAVCKSRRIKKILLRYTNNNIILADSTKNTKVNQVTTRKSITNWKNKSNLILISKCTCGQRYKTKATMFNQTGGGLSKLMITTFDICQGDTHAFKNVIPLRGLAYGTQTRYLLKYIKLLLKGNVSNEEAQLPNFYLAKVMKTAKLPSHLLKKLNKRVHSL